MIENSELQNKENNIGGTLPLNNNLFRFSGRMNRSMFMVNVLGLNLFVGAVVSSMPYTKILQSKYGLVALLSVLVATALVLSYVTFLSSVKRLRDLQKSEWLALLQFIPLVNLGFTIYLAAAPSKVSPPQALTAGTVLKRTGIAIGLFIFYGFMTILFKVASQTIVSLL